MDSYPKTESKTIHSPPAPQTQVSQPQLVAAEPRPEEQLGQAEEAAVFNFDDFEAASEGGNEEHIEDGFGDGSLGDKDKPANDPFAFTNSQAFSSKPGIGEHQFRQPIESYVDNPDFFNSKEFGLVGGIGHSEPGKRQEVLEESIPYISPIKPNEKNYNEFRPKLSYSLIKSLTIYPRERSIHRSKVVFNILSRAGMPEITKHNQFYRKDGSELNSPNPKTVDLSISAFTVGYFFPVVKYRHEEETKRNPPQPAILLISRLPALEVQPKNRSLQKAIEFGNGLEADHQLQETLDLLERELRAERETKSKLTADFEATMAAAMTNKTRFAELMAKHTDLLKLYDDLKAEASTLKQSEATRRTLMLKGITMEEERKEESTQNYLLEEYQKRVELLAKENVELKYRIVEAEVNLQVRHSHKALEAINLAEIEGTIHRLASEKQKMQDKIFQLEAEVRRLNEDLVDKEELVLEVEAIKQVLCMEGDEGVEAITVLRGLLKEDTIPFNENMKDNNDYLRGNTTNNEPKVDLNIQIIPNLINIQKPASQISHPSVKNSESLEEKFPKKQEFFESFGVHDGEIGQQTKKVTPEVQNINVATFGVDSIGQSFNHEAKDEIIFDSFAPETQGKPAVLHSSFNTIPAETEIEAKKNIFALSEGLGLNPIAETPLENLENSVQVSPKVERMKIDDESEEKIEPHFGSEPISKVVNEFALIDKQEIQLEAAHESLKVTDKHGEENGPGDKKRLDHYGSWVSDELFPSIVSPRALNITTSNQIFKNYQSSLAISLNSIKLLSFLQNSNQVFLDSAIQLRLQRCNTQGSHLNFEVLIMPKGVGITLKQAVLSNYTGKYS